MIEMAELLIRATLIGGGGAALMDAWALFARRAFGIQGLDYRLLGRWIGHIPRGRIRHDPIAATAPIRGERILGWVAHYAIGAGFAFLLLLLVGRGWADAPTIGPALAVGMGTIVAPWFVMQPAMGAGIAASRTPNPAGSRLRNLATHAAYGIGLYGSALALSLVWP
jgi:hypothetical protein